MKYLLFFRTIPLAVNLILLVSFVALCIKVLWLNTIPAPMEWMVSFGLIVEGILTSIIASYVFYLFVVHYPEHQKCKAVIPVVASRCQRIGNYSRSIANHVYREAELNELESLYPRKLDFEKLEIALRTIAAKCYEHSDGSQESTQKFFEYVIHDTKRVNEDMQDVLDHINNLVVDYKLTQSLLTLRSSRLEGAMIDTVKYGKYMGLDSGMAKLFYDYNNESLKIYEIGKKLESLYGVASRL